jgi:hypothetical protein
MAASNKKLTTAEFIAKAQVVHGERYDYSQVVYVNGNDKVVVVCPEHGPFSIVPRIHLQMRGCRACAGNTPLTTEAFIEKARQAHGDKYNYSQVIYKSNVGKVRIGCPIHGYFEQRAAAHYESGCYECGKVAIGAGAFKGLTGFIEEARTIHGDSYDYSQTNYTGNQTRLAINCPKHGPFTLLPTSHLLLGAGCPKCNPPKANPARIAKLAKVFEAQARAMHGDKYSYDISAFYGYTRSITIICLIHGSFKQSPRVHIRGMGCPSCGHARRGAERQAKSAAVFIEQCQKLHGTTYDYSKVVYLGNRAKVEIICSLHGSFMQAAMDHKRGSGCQKCKEATMRLHWIDKSKGRIATLYFLRIFNEQEEFYKIGITYNSLKVRYANKGDMPNYSYEALALYTSQSAGAVYDWEQSIIESFTHIKYVPKLPFIGSTECFSSCDEILAIFPL